MSSRKSLGAPVLHAQQGRDRTWRGLACQRTRRTRQLGENDSRGAVGPVSGERVDAGHYGAEHRGGEKGCRHGQHRTQDRTDGTARSTCAALVLARIADLLRRRRTCRVRRRLFVSVVCHVVVLMTTAGVASAVLMLYQRALLHGGGRFATVVVRTAERHGHGSGTLRGDRQHKQPEQKRSDQQPHPLSLPQPVCRSPSPLVPTCACRVPKRQCTRPQPTEGRHLDDKFAMSPLVPGLEPYRTGNSSPPELGACIGQVRIHLPRTSPPTHPMQIGGFSSTSACCYALFR